MIGVVFVRRLREGKTYDDFRAAWYPDEGFGVPARVLAGATLDDPRTIVVDGDHDFQCAPHPVEGDAGGYPWVTPAR